ncbi:MAG TPA: AI-2E family transporter [Terriglobales bacterium]|jgi:predicted PurR-regulated permease PerM
MHTKRATIVFLSALLLIVLGLAFVITQSFLKPFAFAIILAVVFYPLHERILRRNKGRKGGAALLSTLLLILLFAVPGFIITVLAANEALVAAHYLGRRSIEEGGFPSLIVTLANRPLHYIGHWVDLSKYNLNAMIRANAQKVSVWLVGFGANVLSSIARFVIDALITFVVVFFLFRDGAQWAYRAGALLPLSREQVVRLYRNISDTIVANVYGILTVGVAQGVLVGVALRIVGMQSSLLLGLATGFASIIPVLGSALVWAPVVIYLLVTGSIGKGLFLLIWGGVVVSSIDNILRPWVVGGRVELHPLVLLFFIFGGVEAFGFLGLFLGPVVASVLVAIFDILREELSQGKTLPAGGDT